MKFFEANRLENSDCVIRTWSNRVTFLKGKIISSEFSGFEAMEWLLCGNLPTPESFLSQPFYQLFCRTSCQEHPGHTEPRALLNLDIEVGHPKHLHPLEIFALTRFHYAFFCIDEKLQNDRNFLKKLLVN